LVRWRRRAGLVRWRRRQLWLNRRRRGAGLVRWRRGACVGHSRWGAGLRRCLLGRRRRRGALLCRRQVGRVWRRRRAWGCHRARWRLGAGRRARSGRRVGLRGRKRCVWGRRRRRRRLIERRWRLRDGLRLSLRAVCFSCRQHRRHAVSAGCSRCLQVMLQRVPKPQRGTMAEAPQLAASRLSWRRRVPGFQSLLFKGPNTTLASKP
jgi:hypothetical protein